jgi:hypothetical protein
MRKFVLIVECVYGGELCGLVGFYKTPIFFSKTLNTRRVS